MYKNDKRRKLLKSIVAGSGVVFAGKSLPESWSKPVINSVLLPAHASTTDDTDSGASGDTTAAPSIYTYFDENLTKTQLTSLLTETEQETLFASLVDTLVPEARASENPNLPGMSVRVENSQATIEFLNSLSDALFRVVAPIDGAPASPVTTIDTCATRNGPQSAKVIDYTLGDAKIRVNITGNNGSWYVDVPMNPIGTLSLTGCQPVNCLAHDTEVLVSGNKYRKIESLQPGDMIQGMHSDGSFRFTVVTQVVTQHLRRDYFTINGSLRITDDHPVLTVRDGRQAWCRVDDLQVGDRIQSLDGEVRIDSLQYHEQALETVYLETQCGTFVSMANSQHYVVKANYTDATTRLEKGVTRAFAC